jgi:hypothetical protein
MKDVFLVGALPLSDLAQEVWALDRLTESVDVAGERSDLQRTQFLIVHLNLTVT